MNQRSNKKKPVDRARTETSPCLQDTTSIKRKVKKTSIEYIVSASEDLSVSNTRIEFQVRHGDNVPKPQVWCPRQL